MEGMKLRPSLSQSGLRYMGRLASTLAGLALILLAALASVARPAQAHGGGTPQLTNSPAGPYIVSVWTQPDPVRVGEFHITIAVAEKSETREAGDLVLDAKVRVQVQPLDPSGESLTAFATREKAVNKLFYEADLDLPSPGKWQVLVAAQGPAGAGTATFDIEALPASTLSSLLGFGWPLWGGVALAALSIGWLLYTFRSSRSEGQNA
jgi:hypothetical protein